MSGRAIYLGDAGRLEALTNRGTLEASEGSVLFERAGSFSNAGTMRAGIGGLINVDGDLLTLPTARFEVLLGGLSSTQFGRLSVSGNAQLDGQLLVSLANGFVPSVGQSFGFMTLGSRSGTFSSIEDLDDEDDVTYEALYEAAGVTLSVIPV